MSKVIKTNKSKGIISVKPKDAYFQQMKLMSAYIVSQNIKLLNALNLNLDKTKINSLKWRAISHLIYYPKIMHYINTYLNNYFDLENATLNQVLFTISCICKQYKIDNLNKLFYSKYKTEKLSEFISIIQKYYTELGLDSPSSSELSAYTNLYKFGIITDSIIEEMTNLISGIDKTTKSLSPQLQSFIPTISTPKVETKLTFENLSPKIKEYCELIKKYIKGKCKTCQLYSKGAVILDTNIQEPGPVDILILGSNSGNKEYAAGLPLMDDGGKLFRAYLDPLIQKYHLSYIITNCILCVSNINELQNINTIFKNCSPIITEIKRAFPAKLIIALGNEAKSFLNIKGAINKFNNEIVDNCFIMLHPNTAINSKTNLAKFEKSFQKLDEIFKDPKFYKISEQQSTHVDPLINIPPEKIITRFTKELSLFDIKIINEKVIYIMKDIKGCKKYLINDFQMPIYLKSGKYKDCHIIENNVDAVCIITAEERIKLNKILYYHNSKKE